MAVNPFIERIAELNPAALSADGLEDAIIGIVEVRNVYLLAYSTEKCLKVIMERDGMSREDAQEFFDFNVPAHSGDGTPLFIDDTV